MEGEKKRNEKLWEKDQYQEGKKFFATEFALRNFKYKTQLLHYNISHILFFAHKFLSSIFGGGEKDNMLPFSKEVFFLSLSSIRSFHVINVGASFQTFFPICISFLLSKCKTPWGSQRSLSIPNGKKWTYVYKTDRTKSFFCFFKGRSCRRFYIILLPR